MSSRDLPFRPWLMMAIVNGFHMVSSRSTCHFTRLNAPGADANSLEARGLLLPATDGLQACSALREDLRRAFLHPRRNPMESISNSFFGMPILVADARRARGSSQCPEWANSEAWLGCIFC